MKRILLAVGVAAIGATLAIPASASPSFRAIYIGKSRFDKVALNPQPLPPEPCKVCIKFGKPGSWLINPKFRLGKAAL